MIQPEARNPVSCIQLSSPVGDETKTIITYFEICNVINGNRQRTILTGESVVLRKPTIYIDVIDIQNGLSNRVNG